MKHECAEFMSFPNGKVDSSKRTNVLVLCSSKDVAAVSLVQ